LVLLFTFTSCDQTIDNSDFEPKEITIPYNDTIYLKSKTGNFYYFSGFDATCTIQLIIIERDFDLTFGIYKNSNILNDQKIIAVSKTPGISNEEIKYSTQNSEQYLVEVFNNSLENSYVEFSVSYE
jgi:hypothetical protein